MPRSLSNNTNVSSSGGGGGGGDDHTDTPHDLSDITGASTLVPRNDDVSIDGDISVTSGHRYKVNNVALQSTDLFDSASLVRTTASDLTISGTLGANKADLTGLVPQYRINGTQISSANLSDGSDLTKDDEVNTATTTALTNKLDSDFANIGTSVLPDANIPTTITRDSEAVLLVGDQSISGEKSFNGSVYIDSTQTIVSSIAGGGGETEYVASRVSQPALNNLNTLYTSAPANTQKTMPYLEATGTQVFSGPLETPGLSCTANILLSTGSELRVGGTQFASSDLGDSASIVNTTGTAQTKTGNFTVSGTFRAGDLELFDNIHQIQIDSDGHMLFGIPSADEFRFVIGGSDVVVMSASGMSLSGIAVATEQYVGSTLQSDATANSTKLLIESGGGTGFDGSSTSLTMTKINPVVIHSTQHVPDGSGGWTAHPASTANSFRCDCLGTFTNGVSVSSVALGATGDIQKVTEMHTHWQTSITLTSASPNTAVTLFDTAAALTRYEFGSSTGNTDALNSAALATGCFNLLFSFQGYTPAGVANAYLFGSGHIHTNLKVAAYGIPGYNVGTNDTVAPNSVNVPVSQSYHISSVDPPTVRWQAVGGGPALIQLVWSSTMPTITTGTTVVTCKLVKLVDWA